MEEIGIVRRTIQDVLVPEMQGIKERLAAHDEKFVSIEKRLDRIEARLDTLETEMHQGFATVRAVLERIEVRLQFLDFDKRLYRLELLQEHGQSGPKSTAA